MELELIKLDGLSPPEKRAQAWRAYQEIYLNQAGTPVGVHEAHDGERVVFHADTFHRAFFKSSNPLKPKEKDLLDERRVERLKWILPMIAGHAPEVHCYQVRMPDFAHSKRLYVIPRHRFLVWLEPRIDRTRGEWRFASAYEASSHHVKEKTAMGTRIFPEDEVTMLASIDMAAAMKAYEASQANQPTLSMSGTKPFELAHWLRKHLVFWDPLPYRGYEQHADDAI